MCDLDQTVARAARLVDQSFGHMIKDVPLIRVAGHRADAQAILAFQNLARKTPREQNQREHDQNAYPGR